MPVTTPMPNDTAKILQPEIEDAPVQRVPVASRAPSIVASQAASPMVKAGKMMWKLIENANWIRDKSSGVIECAYYHFDGRVSSG